METHLTRLKIVLGPEFISGCESWSSELLRERRQEAENLEASISYARRLIQGRIDVLHTYSREGSPNALQDSFSRVKDAITGHMTAPTSRIAHNDVSGDSLIPTSREISSLVGVDIEVTVDTPEEVQSKLEGLKMAEVQLSGYRKELHRIIDILRHQLVLRYQSGQISVDQILDQDSVS